MFFIKEIEIHNILGCQFVHLRFPMQHISSVYVVQGDSGDDGKCPIFHTLTTAVQLICSAKYVDLEELSQLKDIGNGQVRLIFIVPKTLTPVQIQEDENEVVESVSDDDQPCTSQQARLRELRRKKTVKKPLKRLHKKATATKHSSQYYTINALRDFGVHPQQLSVSVDDGPLRNCTLRSFQERYGLNVDYILPQLDWLYKVSTSKISWLDLNATDISNSIAKSGSTLERYVQLFLKYNYTREHLLSKLTNACLLGNIALNVIQKAQALKVFKDVRRIFEFLSFEEYTVWFLIPRLHNDDKDNVGSVGDYVDINEVIAIDELDFENMRTCIQLKSKDGHKSRRYIWTDTENVFQDLLLVAFQLALAFHCKRRVIYIQNLDALEKHQALEFTTAAFLQRQTRETENSWYNKNYLQRIIDVCLKIRVTAIIESSGGLPASSLVNVNVIKCFHIGDSGVWSMKVMEDDGGSAADDGACTSEGLAAFIEQHLKNY